MMTANEILQAEVIDIIFDGRNKHYGAYLLRKKYPVHMLIAILVVLGLAAVAALFRKPDTLDKYIALRPETDTVKLIALTPEPPKKYFAPVHEAVSTRQFTAPMLVEQIVAEDEATPSMDDLEDSKPSTITMDGNTDVGLAIDNKLNVPAPPVLGQFQAGDDEVLVEVVDEPASFPGGPEAWRRYLERHLQYPNAAVESGTQGEVRVRFIVDREGNISEVEAMNSPGDGLGEEAVRIIKKGPKWKPALRNGRNVKYLHVQVVHFRLEQ